MNTSTHNLSITLRPSRALLIVFSFIHLVAVSALVFISISVWVKAIAIASILIIGIKTIEQYALLTADNSVVKISASSATNQCQIEINNEKILHAHIKDAGWLFEYFAVLVLSTNTKVFKTIIAKDAISQEQFYALRLYLRSFNTQR